MIPSDSVDVTIDLSSDVRSKFALWQVYNPIETKILDDIARESTLQNIVTRGLRIYGQEFAKKPSVGIANWAIAGICCYAIKNVVLGIMGGEELVYDTNFSGLFSSNKTQRTAVGGAITNGAQDANFALDGSIWAYVVYLRIFKPSILLAKSTIISECYDRYINDSDLPDDVRYALLKRKKAALTKLL